MNDNEIFHVTKVMLDNNKKNDTHSVQKVQNFTIGLSLGGSLKKRMITTMCS